MSVIILRVGNRKVNMVSSLKEVLNLTKEIDKRIINCNSVWQVVELVFR